MTLIKAFGLLTAASIFASTALASSFGISTYASNYLGNGCQQQSSYSSASGASTSSSPGGAGMTCSQTSNASTPSGAGSLSSYSVSSSSSAYVNSGFTESVTDWSSASLATGELHLYSSDVNNQNFNDNGTGNWTAAYLNDTLFFTNPNATAQTQWQIVATFEFDGSSTGGDLIIEHPPNSTFIDFGNTVNTLAQWSVDGSNVGCSNEDNTNVTFLACTSTDWITQVTVTVTGPTATVPIGFGMNLASDGNDVADFSNTASVSFTLPQDVTYTSASGVFMTANASVPEPGTFPLVAGIIAAIGLFKRKQSSGGRDVFRTATFRSGQP
jgi:hypothetical protein